MRLVIFSSRGVIARQKIFEGFKARPYLCPAKVWTIGYGATVWNGEKVTQNTRIVTQAMAHEHLKKDMWTALEDCQYIYRAEFGELSPVEQEVLIHMAFQLGGSGLRGFVRMNEAVSRRDATAWADEMKDSLWWNQTRRVASACRNAIIEDEWEDKWLMD